MGGPIRIARPITFAILTATVLGLATWGSTVEPAPESEPVEAQPRAPANAGAGGEETECRPNASAGPGSDGVVLVAQGRWSGGTETTEYLSADEYRIWRCDRSGALVHFQEVDSIEVGGRELSVVSGELRAEPRSGPLRPGAQPRLAGAFMTYPDSSRVRRERWAPATRDVLAPTPPSQEGEERLEDSAHSEGGAPDRAGRAATGSGRCADRSHTTLWALDRNAGYEVHFRTLPHGRRTLRRIIEAHRTWNRTRNRCGLADTTSVRMPFAGRARGRIKLEDGRDGVDFGPLAAVGCRAPALACAIPSAARWGPDGEIVPTEIDIRFRRSARWSSNRRRPSPRRQDVRSTATHEAGHKLGLGHVAQRTGQAMCTPCGVPGTTYRRTLGAGDVAGLRRLYGGGELIRDSRYD